METLFPSLLFPPFWAPFPLQRFYFILFFILIFHVCNDETDNV